MHHTSPIVIAWMLVLVSLLVLIAGPAAPVGEAAKDASILYAADRHTSPFRLHRDQVRGGDT